ncbi:hypothetical protein [Sinosporangium siamense]|uniref:hypothetical protein n=1 Tax=Sinosporangium siamense TaxID=1367973 RepID=UPI00194F792D|nr:hypothetical protein [Sinosporangium siamense]
MLASLGGWFVDEPEDLGDDQVGLILRDHVAGVFGEDVAAVGLGSLRPSPARS